MKKITKIEDLYPFNFYLRETWLKFSPSERLRRSWQLRQRLKDLKKLHDKKIFPAP